MKLNRAKVGVSDPMEGINVLGNHTGDEIEAGKVGYGMMRSVGMRLIQTTPAEKRACPVSFACFVRGDEFVEVDGSVRLVLCVCAVGATIVSEA